jgi:hypothetical protein
MSFGVAGAARLQPVVSYTHGVGDEAVGQPAGFRYNSALRYWALRHGLAVPDRLGVVDRHALAALGLRRLTIRECLAGT